MKRNVPLQSILMLVFIALLGSGDARAEWLQHAQTRMFHDSNLTNGTVSNNIFSAWALDMAGAVGNYTQLNDSDSLSISTEVKGTAYNHFNGLDNLTASVDLELKRKWMVGQYAPWTSIFASGQRLQYRDNVRKGWLFLTEAKIGKRLSERWDVWTSVGIEKRTADHNVAADQGVSGAAFDLTNKLFKLSSVYAFNEHAFLTLGYEIRRGDAVSTSVADQPGVDFDAVMTAVTFDPLFGPDAEAYRLDATSHTVCARINVALPHNGLLGIEYQRNITHADGGLNYTRSQPAIILSYFF